jgi:hypothetical protein
MQKLPAERFQTADEALEALNAQAVADYSALDALTPDEAVPGGMVIQGSGWAMDTDLEPNEEIRPTEEDVYSGQQDAEPIKEEGWDPITGTGSQTMGIMSLEDQFTTAEPSEPSVEPASAMEPVEKSRVAPSGEAPPPPERPRSGTPPPREPPKPSAATQRRGPDPREVAETVAGRNPRRKNALLAVGAVAVLAVGAVFVFGVGRGRAGSAGPRYTLVTNSLLEPVVLMVSGQVADTLWPQQSDTLDGGPSVSWRLLPPLGPGGQPLGGEFSGVLSGGVESQGNRIFDIVGRTPGQAMFAPVISNPTNRALIVLVNADIPEAAPCECLIPPRSTDVHIGYYPLRSNPTFRFYPARSNYRGPYTEVVEMAGRIDASSGMLRVEVPRR